MLDTKELLGYAERCRTLADRSRIDSVSRRLKKLAQSYTEEAQGRPRAPSMCASRTCEPSIKVTVIKSLANQLHDP